MLKKLKLQKNNIGNINNGGEFSDRYWKERESKQARWKKMRIKKRNKSLKSNKNRNQSQE